MEQEIQNLKNWLTNSDMARIQLINDNDKHFKAIETNLFTFAKNLTDLSEEVKKIIQAQVTLNKLFAGQIKELETKVNSLELSKVSITPTVTASVPLNKRFKWF